MRGEEEEDEEEEVGRRRRAEWRGEMGREMWEWEWMREGWRGQWRTGGEGERGEGLCEGGKDKVKPEYRSPTPLPHPSLPSLPRTPFSHPSLPSLSPIGVTPTLC